MSQGEPDTQTSGLGECVGQVGRQTQVVLDFVDDDVDRVAFGFRDGGPLEGGLPQVRHDEGAEQRGRFRPHRALRERDEQDLAIGEDLTQREPRPHLTDDGTHGGAQQEGTELVHDRGDDGHPLGVRQLLVPGPERAKGNRVFPHRCLGDGAPEPRVGQQQGQHHQ